MRKFNVHKPIDRICAEAAAAGWEVGKSEYDAGGDGIWLRDTEGRMLQVRFNTVSGAFAVWNPSSTDVPAATHLDDKFDGQPWYDEILELLYLPAETPPEAAADPELPAVVNVARQLVDELREALVVLEDGSYTTGANCIRMRIEQYEKSLSEIKPAPAVPVFDADVPIRGGVVCSVRVKYTGQSIHLLDLDGDMSLTNALGIRFCRSISERLGLDSVLQTWVCYHTDNVVSCYTFDSGQMFVPAAPELWDAAMAAEMHRLYGEKGSGY